MTKEFDLSDVLTVTTGCLLSTRHMEGIYDILNHMTGDNLFTHQLPRASEVCKPALLEQYPALRDVKFPENLVAGEIAQDRAREIIDEWMFPLRESIGDKLSITPLSEWHHMNPIQELAEAMEVPRDKIIVAVMEDDDEKEA